MIKYIVIFLAVLLADIAWALYIRWTSSGKAIKAALCSVLVYVVSAFTFGEFVKNPEILIPASLGCFVGTYVTIKYLDVQKPSDKV